MGLYQLILALYMVFVSFATAGINVASARLAAQSLARGSGMAETLRGLSLIHIFPLLMGMRGNRSI